MKIPSPFKQEKPKLLSVVQGDALTPHSPVWRDLREREETSVTSSYGDNAAYIAALFPAQQGFDPYYNGKDKDRHIKRFGVQCNPAQVRVWLHDKDADDKFAWTLWYVDVDR